MSNYKKSKVAAVVISILSTIVLPQAVAARVDNDTPVSAIPAGSPAGDWQLVFSDEFNDTSVNLNKWRLPYAERGWNNGISWFHTKNNISQDGENLVVSYVQNNKNRFSSGRADTQGLFEKAYGYFETRVKITEVVGKQSAFWLMPKGGFNDADGTANNGAEIDVLEARSVNDEFATNIHYDGYGAYHRSSHSDVGAVGIHKGFHTFGLEWSPTVMKFYYDGVLKRSIKNPKLITQIKQYPIVSGGIFEGPWVDGSIRDAQLPATGLYDYVRVYHNKQMEYGNGYFKLVNKYSGLPLSQSGDKHANAEVVNETGNDVEMFQMKHLGDGKYNIINRVSNNCLKVVAKDDVYVMPCSASHTQEWAIEAAEGNYVKFKNVKTGLYLNTDRSASDDSNNNGEHNVSVAPEKNIAVQKWEITWLENND